MVERAIFHDPTGRRGRRFGVALTAFILLLIAATGLFIASIVSATAGTPLPFTVERPPVRDLGQLAHDTRRDASRVLRRASWLAKAGPNTAAPLAVGFHAPWDDASAASLVRHIGDLDWLVPAWVSVTGPDHRVTRFPDLRARAIIAAAPSKPKILPMVQNALQGEWDGPGMARLLGSPAARKAMLDNLEAGFVTDHVDGIFFDFENLPPSAQRDYLAFLREARIRCARHGWRLAMAVPVGNPEWNLKAYAAIVDRMFLMAYDEHDPAGDPGPIASQPWFVQTVASDLRGLPAGKVVVALGSYVYDWSRPGIADATSVEQALLTAHESSVLPHFDSASGNVTYQYDGGGDVHTVWMLDAASVHNQMLAVRALGVNAFALWRLGTEDPSVWRIFGRGHPGPVAPAAIETIPAGINVDIEGSGEILHVGATPVVGQREVTVDRRGLIVDTRFVRLPTPYAIERAGYRPGLVALTFDDGPDPNWTPKILDVLKAKHVPATFFVIGENALPERGLLRRELAEGHEIGNHTYTHPNLGTASARTTRIELNANQRLFEAFTERSLRLFRAPYFGDAEPTTADEIDPVTVAQALGYLTVGLHVDPADWRRPGVDAIIKSTIDGVEDSTADRSGNIVLLHDAGGDRSQTVAALPILIDVLRARGYRFVPVSALIGLSSAQVMPALNADQLAAARTDLALFDVLGASIAGLRWVFGIAITLGIGRALTLSALALWQARREAGVIRPPIDPERFVSVLIPAFNEARVIETSVRRVLASRDVRLEVIVLDDGSKDATSAIVAAAFAGDPRVRLLTLVNGGKARALNHGLSIATGEIVVALDADTQFEPDTIARLARWFADPAIGAVAGNAKVGNRVNLVTRWQALEYITAQNLERRALVRLDAMTVVPGAVGAWRAETIRGVGGYPADTLAEDQDLTIAIQRAGWRVMYDQDAVAWTEAPESFAALARQRYRWAFGTLQCVWKHRGIFVTGKPKGLARIGLPQVIVFQVVFAAISPVIDLALVASIVATYLSVVAHGWAATQTDVARMGLFWLAFGTIDILAGVVAFGLEANERWRLLWLMLPQRFGYRQIMYYVVIRALSSALRGPSVGWGKLERSGRVDDRVKPAG
jgi:cellulose synthase/poly-beta-1,6-N-acetylglucosamine synthase-like glycosyltransferase/peptidoglycan/xylan/chitin deacetylase (PgdA/CDA1 family)/spore germination protein YaaH